MANKKTDEELLEVVWAATNCAIDPVEIMRAIEKHVGMRKLKQRWAKYFDDEHRTEKAIRADLKR